MRATFESLFFGIFLLAPIALRGQAMLEQRVTAAYEQARIEYVLKDLEERYGVHFSYSLNQIPLDQRVDLEPMEGSLANVLDRVFERTKVVYTIIGRQIVLKYAPDKPIPPIKRRESRQEKTYEEPQEKQLGSGDQIEDSWPEGVVDLGAARVDVSRPVEPIAEVSDERKPFYGQYEFDDFSLRFLDSMNVGKGVHQNVAQLSFFPFISTSEKHLVTTSNHYSVNLLGGVHGGVEGWEAGTLVNVSGGGVQGLQFGGVGNVVSAGVQGWQVGGLFNVAHGQVKGIQLAGAFNVGEGGGGWQISGGFNVSSGAFNGVQWAGLFNVAADSRASYQAAGLFNVQGKGDALIQVAPLFNYAGKVERLQLGLLNMARESEGLQLGLVNVSGGGTGTTVGLLNFVRKGYNRVEIAGGDALYGNLGLKLGSKGFYNILQLGMRADTRPLVKDGQRTEDEFLTWALGYGIGTYIPLSARTGLNLEGVSLHVNEAETWTDDLNLLNQLRLTLDFGWGKRFSLFGGGTFNVLVSKRKDPITGAIGTRIAPYTWSDRTAANGVNAQLWAGFNAGVRF